VLWDASAINGYAIEASDGRLGTVSDLLFEEVSWVVRLLVVDTGNWLPGRKVLLPLSVLGRPDRALRHFPVKLTMHTHPGQRDHGLRLWTASRTVHGKAQGWCTFSAD
jgi:hypothetical protein